MDRKTQTTADCHKRLLDINSKEADLNAALNNNLASKENCQPILYFNTKAKEINLNFSRLLYNLLFIYF